MPRISKGGFSSRVLVALALCAGCEPATVGQDAASTDRASALDAGLADALTVDGQGMDANASDHLSIQDSARIDGASSQDAVAGDTAMAGDGSALDAGHPDATAATDASLGVDLGPASDAASVDTALEPDAATALDAATTIDAATAQDAGLADTGGDAGSGVHLSGVGPAASQGLASSTHYRLRLVVGGVGAGPAMGTNVNARLSVGVPLAR
ncbi:MAG: hypothetical protein ABIJ09_26900 [Pseudomonadota bacterium]